MELAPCDHDLETAAELRGARREIFMRAPNWRTSWIGVVRSRGRRVWIAAFNISMLQQCEGGRGRAIQSQSVPADAS